MNTPTWRVAGASVQGSAHLSRGLPCQDAHAARGLPGGELLLAVADGAGSAECADIGAALAVQHCIDALSAPVEGVLDAGSWPAALRAAFRRARAAIVQAAEQDDRPLRQYATTLSAAVVTDQQLIVAQIGDGLVVAEDDAGELVLAARPQRGEYANEAYFLTLPNADDVVDVVVWEMQVQAIAFSTDGLLRLALRLPDYSPHAPFFAPLFAFLRRADAHSAERQLADFLASPRVCARTDDDKTLLLAVRQAADETVHDTAREGAAIETDSSVLSAPSVSSAASQA
jgi:hypothetical protein